MPRVLIVDDDKITTSLLQTLLEIDGFEVALAPDGATGMQKARETPPDAFLVDYHLSDGDGVEFIRKLRATAQFGKTPIVMASGLDREDEALAAGANHFLTKPFDPGDLVDILKGMLGIA